MVLLPLTQTVLSACCPMPRQLDSCYKLAEDFADLTELTESAVRPWPQKRQP